MRLSWAAPVSHLRLRASGSAPPSSTESAQAATTDALKARLIIVGTCGLIAGAIVYGAAVWTPIGQAYDDRVISSWRVSHPAAEVYAARALATLGLPWLTVMTTLLAGWALLRRRLRLTVAVLAMIAGATITAEALKNVVLPRPVLGARDPVLGFNSFPSGHVTVAAVLAAGLICVAPRSIRPLAAAASVAYAVLIGAAALFLGWHRPSDIVGGYLTALVWAAFVTAALCSGMTARGASDSDAGRPMHLFRDVAVATLGTFAAVALAFVIIRRQEAAIGAVALTRAFWVGLAVTAVTANMALVVFWRALGDADLR